jgi:acetyltransferase
MLRVDTLQQMFLAAETLARFRSNRSAALAILCNGTGTATMAADAARQAGVPLASLAEATCAQLSPLLAQPPAPAAPLVLDDHAPPEAQAQALRLLQDDPAGAALLLIHAPSAQVSSAQLARTVLPLATQPPPRLLGCWLGDAAVAEARRIFGEAGVAHYATPEEAVSAFAMLADYRRNQAQLIEAPPERSPEVPAGAAAARALVQRVLGSGHHALDPGEARALLGGYGIEVAARFDVPPEPYAAASAAELAGYPVALRLLTDDADGPLEETLRLDLRSAVQVRDAARRLLANWRRQESKPPARRFVVMHLPALLHARALLVGTRIDPVFGPVILLGHGGENVDTAAELAVALPPLNLPLARALVQRSGVGRLLRAQGEVPAADEEALLRVLVSVSQLLTDLAPLQALDFGPLRVGPAGAVVMQASVQLSVTAPAGALNFAIRPYPAHLAETLQWQGRELTVRPIRPEDEAQHLRFLAALDPADIRLRVFHTRRSIERSELARLTQIDYAREMALIAVEPDPEGGERTLGVVRAIADPDNASAEFAIVVRSDLKGRRLGELLLRRIIDVQREHGTGRLVATVLPENTRMLELARRLGFAEHGSPEGTRFIDLPLRPSSPVDGSAGGAAPAG